MNERLKELEQQCWSHRVDGVLVDGHLHFDTKKFAELIINECLRMCDCADVSLLEHSYPREADGASSVKIFIKEHFGIEE
jgi:hypothetical protein